MARRRTNASQRATSYSYAKKENQYLAFERLPRSVRDTLNSAAFSWAPYPIWRAWEAGEYKSAKELIKAIRKWDRDCHKRDIKRDRYIVPYQGSLSL